MSVLPNRELLDVPTDENVPAPPTGEFVDEDTVVRSQWRLFCFNTDQFELDFQRPAVTNGFFPAISISNPGSAPQYFKSPPVRSVMAIRRPRLNSCWSMQSAIQATAATVNTNQ